MLRRIEQIPDLPMEQWRYLPERLGKKRPGVENRIHRSKLDQLSRTQVLIIGELGVHFTAPPAGILSVVRIDTNQDAPANLTIEDMNREILCVSFVKLW